VLNVLSISNDVVKKKHKLLARFIIAAKTLCAFYFYNC